MFSVEDFSHDEYSETLSVAEYNNGDNDTSIHHDCVLNSSNTLNQSNQSMSTHVPHLPVSHSDKYGYVTTSVISGQITAQENVTLTTKIIFLSTHQYQDYLLTQNHTLNKTATLL
ncbi:hypothetical protein GJ496_001310 [Pomphorhynchus laevis]|nr:hypothetical protein GJ496_001310 [Pomphorhynchus laevis]